MQHSFLPPDDAKGLLDGAMATLEVLVPVSTGKRGHSESHADLTCDSVYSYPRIPRKTQMFQLILSRACHRLNIRLPNGHREKKLRTNRKGVAID